LSKFHFNKKYWISQGEWCDDSDVNLNGKLTDMMLYGNIYVNIHTEKYPSGEIRGQLFQTFGYWGWKDKCEYYKVTYRKIRSTTTFCKCDTNDSTENDFTEKGDFSEDEFSENTVNKYTKDKLNHYTENNYEEESTENNYEEESTENNYEEESTENNYEEESTENNYEEESTENNYEEESTENNYEEESTENNYEEESTENNYSDINENIISKYPPKILSNNKTKIIFTR
jgi:hypothetical protein